MGRPYFCFMDILLKYFSDFTPKQIEQYKALEELYKEWNEKINVISRKDIDGLYEKHILHSLAIAATFEFPPGLNIIDIGTGGGFPGVPLAIFFPEVNFYLVDSIGKKLKEEDLINWFWLLDIWMFFYYLIFIPAVWKKPKKDW